MRKIIIALIVILFFLLLIWLWILLFGNDNPETENGPATELSDELDSNAESEADLINSDSEESGNSDNSTSTEDRIKIYRDPFIQASIDFGCELLENSDLENDATLMSQRLDSIYRQYNLPVDNDQLMVEILNTYETNVSVLEAIQQGTSVCRG